MRKNSKIEIDRERFRLRSHWSDVTGKSGWNGEQK